MLVRFPLVAAGNSLGGLVAAGKIAIGHGDDLGAGKPFAGQDPPCPAPQANEAELDPIIGPGPPGAASASREISVGKANVDAAAAAVTREAIGDDSWEFPSRQKFGCAERAEGGRGGTTAWWLGRSLFVRSGMKRKSSAGAQVRRGPPWRDLTDPSRAGSVHTSILRHASAWVKKLVRSASDPLPGQAMLVKMLAMWDHIGLLIPNLRWSENRDDRRELVPGTGTGPVRFLRTHQRRGRSHDRGQGTHCHGHRPADHPHLRPVRADVRRPL